MTAETRRKLKSGSEEVSIKYTSRSGAQKVSDPEYFKLFINSNMIVIVSQNLLFRVFPKARRKSLEKDAGL